MDTGTPSLTKVITMVLFALSCVGLLLFLWLSFGGNVPFNPQGYEFRVSFTNADQLATQADVRIAGVSVGRVISKSSTRRATARSPRSRCRTSTRPCARTPTRSCG